MLLANSLCLAIDDVVIYQVEHTKSLDVITNPTLTGKDHIKTVCKKPSKGIGILGGIKTKLNADILLTLLQPYLQYCNISLASQHTIHLTRLLIKRIKLFG